MRTLVAAMLFVLLSGAAQAQSTARELLQRKEQQDSDERRKEQARAVANVRFCYGPPPSWDDCVGVQNSDQGGKYIGDFKLGLLDGFGAYFWASGSHFIGQWHRNYRTGYGTYYYANGTISHGLWHTNEFAARRNYTEDDDAQRRAEREILFRYEEAWLAKPASPPIAQPRDEPDCSDKLFLSAFLSFKSWEISKFYPLSRGLQRQTQSSQLEGQAVSRRPGIINDSLTGTDYICSVEWTSPLHRMQPAMRLATADGYECNSTTGGNGLDSKCLDQFTVIKAFTGNYLLIFDTNTEAAAQLSKKGLDVRRRRNTYRILVDPAKGFLRD